MKRQELLNEVWNAVFGLLDSIEHITGDEAGEMAQAAVEAVDQKLDPEMTVFSSISY